jgi:phage regulator Rha-like protein
MQQNPSSGALVVIEEHIPLADSREIAAQLGIAHRSFFRMITDYQQEIEADFGQLRLEFAVGYRPQGGGNPSRYALLTEDQTYAYLAYSQNTQKARMCKRKLVKAFAEAREQIAQLTRQQEQAPPPQINSLWQRRLEIFYRQTSIPAGYWCVFGMVGGYCFTDALRAVPLIKEALPDGSIGKRWCQHLRACGYDLGLIRKYPHRYPDKRGVQLANIYPNAWLGEFWTWFHEQYLKHDYPRYLQTHAACAQPEALEGPKASP